MSGFETRVNGMLVKIYNDFELKFCLYVEYVGFSKKNIIIAHSCSISRNIGQTFSKESQHIFYYNSSKTQKSMFIFNDCRTILGFFTMHVFLIPYVRVECLYESTVRSMFHTSGNDILVFVCGKILNKSMC